MGLIGLSNGSIPLHLFCIQWFYFAFHFTLLQSLFSNLSTFDKVVNPELKLRSADLSNASKHQLRMMLILDF